MKKVRINQTGYLPKTIKYAVFADLSPEDDSFKVIEKTTGKVVFEGEISKQKEFKTSGEANSTGYFTEVETAGTYIIETGKGEKSNEFVIGDSVYDKLLLDVFRVLYLQRCGVELPESLAGIYAHPACHTQIGHIHGTDKTLDVSGGWHDAGDYGRYIVSAAKTVADLFIAYNVNPALFTDEMNIPESGNGISDLLDEARFELEWMLKMQDEVTGGAYHKVTGYSFPAFIMPEEESWDMVICPVSNTATADFAATMALAYTMYKDVDG
ncbi:MAG: glycoside hydrolase family 9 protein, partial [Pseudobutyrivibrio sp.]|nr:glycoside hydrolase family 9 protein [Pseudobutyrivibrio sp.]